MSSLVSITARSVSLICVMIYWQRFVFLLGHSFQWDQNAWQTAKRSHMKQLYDTFNDLLAGFDAA